MANDYNRYVTLNFRIHWKTPEDQFSDEDTDEVYGALKLRLEECIANNVCGQVGAVPGTEQMELLYGVVI